MKVVMQTLGNRRGRKHVYDRFDRRAGDIYATHKSLVERNGVTFWEGVFTLKQPFPWMRCGCFDFNERNIPILVEREDVVANGVAPLKGDHKSTMGEAGCNQELTCKTVQVFLFVRYFSHYSPEL